MQKNHEFTFGRLGYQLEYNFIIFEGLTLLMNQQSLKLNLSKEIINIRGWHYQLCCRLLFRNPILRGYGSSRPNNGNFWPTNGVFFSLYWTTSGIYIILNYDIQWYIIYIWYILIYIYNIWSYIWDPSFWPTALYLCRMTWGEFPHVGSEISIYNWSSRHDVRHVLNS